MLITSNPGRTLHASRLARCLIAVFGLWSLGAQADFLDAATQQKVRAATFEVVMLKPVDDPITYEKPLPLDLLPYQFRTDKYFSIGTAFAMGSHRFATAAHVFSAGIVTQWGTPELRDAAGHVYPIDKVLKYSTDQDFAVFSVVGDPDVQPLEIGPHPTLNDPVYAVGNALGEGVVIRDGLYTSDTPEERDGRWKWLRFSAAASPGNSGGPLLDKSGRVVGIVLRKSPNENLNYALSIDQIVGAKDNTAIINNRETDQLDIFDFKQTEVIDKEFDLPKSYADFSKSYTVLWYAYEDQMIHDLLKNNADNTFPHGEGATELLHTALTGDTPGLIMKSEDGSWHVQHPAQSTRSDLGHNGYVSAGTVGHSALVKLRRPDDVPAATFYSDSGLFMDLMLKGLPLHRNVGSESVKMTSLGKATVDSIFIDSYQRKWQLREWPMAFQDSMVISLSLPVPDGYVSLLRFIRSSGVHDSVNDLKSIADFIAMAYGGTLDQWQDFRKQADLMPAAMDKIDIQFEYGKSLHYESPRLSFSYTPDLLKITRSNQLYLDFSYFNDHGHTVWDVGRIYIGENATSNSYVAIARFIEPSASMTDEYKSHWGKIVHRQHPYDAVITNDGDLSFIHGVHEPTGKAVADDSDPAVLYTVMVETEGTATQDAMKAKLDHAMQGLAVNDDRAPAPKTATDAQD